MKQGNVRDRIEDILRSTVRDAKGSDQEETNLLIHAASSSILDAVVRDLPAYLDIEGRFETKPGQGVYIKLYEHPDKTDLDEKMDLDQLEYLADYADAEGFNKAIFVTKRHLQSLYMAN